MVDYDVGSRWWITVAVGLSSGSDEFEQRKMLIIIDH